MSLREKRRMSKGKKEILEIIKTCQAIENREFNPFLLNIEQALKVLEKHLQFWRSTKDQCLDGEALNEISKVVLLQESQLRFQSSKLYLDPKLLVIKFRSEPIRKLAEAFISCWHPIVELEQLTMQNIENALGYWHKLLPIEKRLKRLKMDWPKKAQDMYQEELSRIGILSKEDFSIRLEKLWNEIRTKYSAEGKVEYHNIVWDEDFLKTVNKAYYVSFLITHGFVKLERDEKKLLLIPVEKENIKKTHAQFSFPISISNEDRIQWNQNL